MYSSRLAAPVALASWFVASGALAAESAGSRRAEGGEAPAAQADSVPQLTPTERMNRRFPQKVRVGDLLGLPLQDDDDRVMGHVEQVRRTAEGNVVLVMKWEGWSGRGSRAVGIPLEAVAILGRHINVVDLSRKDVIALPDWKASGNSLIAPEDSILIAISRR